MEEAEDLDWTDPVVEAQKTDVDRTSIRENLKPSYEERLLKLMDHQRFARELKSAGERTARKNA